MKTKGIASNTPTSRGRLESSAQPIPDTPKHIAPMRSTFLIRMGIPSIDASSPLERQEGSFEGVANAYACRVCELSEKNAFCMFYLDGSPGGLPSRIIHRPCTYLTAILTSAVSGTGRRVYQRLIKMTIMPGQNPL